MVKTTCKLLLMSKYGVVCLQRKEDEMMSRIRDAEHSQLVAEMRQKIAELEIEVSYGVHCTLFFLFYVNKFERINL